MISFVGQSMRDSSSPLSNTSRLVNWWREPIGQGGKAQFILRAALGMSSIGNTGAVFALDMFEFDGSAFALMAGKLVQVTGSGVTPIGTVATGYTGQISRNAQVVTLATGGLYYTWNGTTLANVTGLPFTSIGSVDYLAGRTVVSEAGGVRFCWSDIAAPATFNGLNFASAEAREDKLLRLLAVNGVLMLFGERSTELWAPGGSGVNAFTLIGGSVVDRGIKAFGLACKIEGAVFLVGSDGIAYVVAGNNWQAVSTPAVNTAIMAGDATRCFYWEHRGHKFCAIGFKDRPAWVYCLTTGEWFERAEGVNKGPWQAAASARITDGWAIAANSGAVALLTDVVTDFNAPMLREATSYSVQNDGKWFTLAEVEVLTGAGFSEPASIMLEIGNGGTFGPIETRQVGGLGDFIKRTVFRAKGRHINAVARLSMTDPVDLPVFADVNVRLA